MTRRTPRKTIPVADVLKMANHFLAAKNTNADEREAVASLLEAILFETGNYKGFAYLDKKDYPDEVDGLGSRRRYIVGWNLYADYHKEPLREVNKIRV